MTDAMRDDESQRFPQWTLGDRLRKSRELADLSQHQMGEQLADLRGGVPFKHSTVGAWEADLSQPRNLMAVVYRWAEITGVDAAWLLGVPPGAHNPRYGKYGPVVTEVPFTGQMSLFGHPEDVFVTRSLELVKA